MSAGSTSILALPIYDNTDDIDYNEINTANNQLDRLPPTLCTNATRPGTNLFTGRLIYETDTDRTYMWTGAAWKLITDKASSAWTDFSSTIVAYDHVSTTSAVVASSPILAKYRLSGKTVWAQAEVTINAATTGGVALALPFTAKDRNLNCGTAALFGTTTPSDQCGIAYMSGNKDKIVIVAYTNGFRDAANGAVFRYNVVYEIP